jgi:TetR/AcrR family transcriptional regulator, cholesterol catabolism regulator
MAAGDIKNTVRRTGRIASGQTGGSRKSVASDSAEDFRSHSSIITDAAMHLFGVQGYSGTTMRDIAKAVGVLPGSLYAHIASKETLLVDIVDVGIRTFLSAVEPHASSNGSPKERMRSAIKAHIAVVAENPQRSLVVFHQWRFLSEANLAVAIQKRRRYERAFIRITDDGVARGEFNPDLNTRVAVLTILGALNWTPEWYSPRGVATPEELGDMMADTLLNGVLRLRGTAP